MSHLLQRVAQALLLLLSISGATFLLAEAAPGDYLAEMRLDPAIGEGAVSTLRDRYGLDRPLPLRYWAWLSSVARGELGYSFAYGTPVAPLLLRRARNTLLLAAVATAAAWLVALPLGVWSAYRRGGLLDRVGQAGSALAQAVPELLLGLAALWLAAATGLFPLGGMLSLDHDSLSASAKVLDVVHHLTLPVTALALVAVPALLRHTRSAVAEALASPALTFARSLGLPPRHLLFVHALRLAANPLLTLFGSSLAGLLSGSFMIEVLLSWPGLGPLFLEAILARDLHLLVGAVLISSLFLIAGHAVADGLLRLVDPRIRRAWR